MRLLAASLALFSALLSSCSNDELVFHDVEAQTAQFMEWEQSIRLTPEQEAVKKAALEALPAPCCGENSAYTCCCPCNLSRTVWGLSQHLIAERNYSALQVRGAVEDWLAFVNPAGFSGDVCARAGGCGRPFEKDGCGGMNPNQVVF